MRWSVALLVVFSFSANAVAAPKAVAPAKKTAKAKKAKGALKAGQEEEAEEGPPIEPVAPLQQAPAPPPESPPKAAEPQKAAEPAKPAPAVMPPLEPVRVEPPKPEPIAPRAEKITITDKSTRGAMAQLAKAIGERFARTRAATEPFHRIAVPYFKEATENAQKEQVGKLLAEVMSVELQQQKSFVLVERERLDQLMREHRLADIGVVDEGTAAAFGKVLGAQSLILGTVTEAGADYVVTIRQVDAQTGQAMVAAQAEVERKGLIALSSEAIETRSRGGAILRSAIVPGWGQIYNKEPVKGAIITSGAVAALGMAAGFFIASTVARNEYNRNVAETVHMRQVANNWIMVANISLGVLAAVWAYGVIDAAVNGRDYSSIKVSTDSPASGFAF